MKLVRLLAATFLLLLLASTSLQAQTVTMFSGGAGDGIRCDDSYGSLDHNYYSDMSQMDTWRSYWQPGWGAQNVYIEVPISQLAGGILSSATLQFYTPGGFGTGYYYGSVSMSHLNPGAYQPTGNIATDTPHTWGGDYGWTVWDSYGAPPTNDGSPGWRSFDVTAALMADIAAGRSYSCFAMSASRDTSGSVLAGESGMGPRIVAQGEFPNAVPLPGSVILLVSGLATVALRRVRKQD